MICKNCNKTLNQNQRYCDDCGAKVIYNRLTPKVLARQLNEEFISIDNKFLRTFIDLFRKPEVVIEGFINGARKKYINVVQYLAISITFLGLQYFIINSINPSYFIPEPSAFDEALAKYYPPEALKNIENLSKLMNEYMSLIYLIGLPISALITWIVFLKERLHNFTEHMVINMYVTAQYIIYSFFLYLAFFALRINISILITISSILYVFYFGFVLYKLYHLKVSTIFLRFIYSLIVFTVFSIIFSILFTIVALIYLKLIK